MVLYIRRATQESDTSRLSGHLKGYETQCSVYTTTFYTPIKLIKEKTSQIIFSGSNHFEFFCHVLRVSNNWQSQTPSLGICCSAPRVNIENTPIGGSKDQVLFFILSETLLHLTSPADCTKQWSFSPTIHFLVFHAASPNFKGQENHWTGWVGVYPFNHISQAHVPTCPELMNLYMPFETSTNISCSKF